MNLPLFAFLFTNDLSSPVYVLDLTPFVSNITLIWGLHGGLLSIELHWSTDWVSAYDFYNRYMGYRVIITDQYIDRPVADGFVMDVEMSASGIKIIANGFWTRHYDQLYVFDTTNQDTNQGNLVYNPVANSFQDDGQDFADWESGSAPAVYQIIVANDDDTETWGYIGAAFTTSGTDDSIYVYTTDQLTIAGWNGEGTGGKTPSTYTVTIVYTYRTTSEVVQEALTAETPAVASDQSNIDDTGTVIGFWEPPIEEGGIYPAEVIEKMASFSDSSNTQWNYWLVNAPFDGISPQQPIPYFKAQVNDGSFDWEIQRWMVKAGGLAATRNLQELRNDARVIYRDMENEDTITITATGSNATSIATYWQREIILSGGDSVAEVAENYRDLYLDKYSDAQLAKPITITSPYIFDTHQGTAELWFPIKHNKGYFRVSDLFPDIDIFNLSTDRKHTGQAVNMEYSAAANELRVFLDLENNELDALLARIDAFR